MPFALMAGIGFVAVFSGAANTPITTTIMAMELFGTGIGPLAAIGCVTAYLFSGHAGIYHAQRVGHSKHRKHRLLVPDGIRIAELGRFRQQKLAATRPVANDQQPDVSTDKAMTTEERGQ
jgi:hypothetical protein